MHKYGFCMFFECNSLTSLDLSGFDTSACTDIYAMFKGCKLLTYVLTNVMDGVLFIK